MSSNSCPCHRLYPGLPPCRVEKALTTSKNPSRTTKCIVSTIATQYSTPDRHPYLIILRFISLADDVARVVSREDRAEHVKRTDIRHGLAASVRVRGEDEISERLLQHDDSSIPNRRPRGEEGMKKFSVGGRWFVGSWWVGSWWVMGGLLVGGGRSPMVSARTGRSGRR